MATKLQQQEITEVLTRLGLNQKDQEVYLALLKSGPVTVTPLANAINCPVTTAQSVLNRLVDRGVIKVGKQKSRHVFEAHDPVVFRRLLERQVQDVASVIPLLQKMQTGSSVTPKIRIFYRERMTDIFHQALKCKSKLVYEIVAARDFQDIIGERFHFTRRRVKDDVRLKSLRVQKREIKKYSKQSHLRELREAKFLPPELNFRCSIMFWDDTIAFFTTKEEGLAWTVQSKTLRKTMEQIFDLLWSVSRKMETKQE